MNLARLGDEPSDRSGRRVLIQRIHRQPPALRAKGSDGVVHEERVTFTFDGQRIQARPNEPVAVALWRAGVLTQTRSIKYHRPRGPMCLTGDCPGCMVRIDGVPNLPGCQIPAADGLTVESQVGMPSAERDALSIVDRVFKHFDHERAFVRPRPVRAAYEAIARRLSGFGEPPTGEVQVTDGERIEVDVLVVGAGPAGLAAASTAAGNGASVALAERDAPGGSLLHTPTSVSHPEHGALPGPELARAMDEGLASNVQRIRGPVLGLYPEATLAADERSDGLAVHTIQAARTVLATGAYEGPVLVPGNDTPGVLGARAARILLNRYELAPGEDVVLVEPGREGRAFEREAEVAGLELTVLDSIERIEGSKRVKRVHTDEATVPADAVVLDPGLTPAPELGRQAGIPYVYERTLGGRVPVHEPTGLTPVPGVYVAGSCAGLHTSDAAIHQGRAAGALAAGGEPDLDTKVLLGSIDGSDEIPAALERVWRRA